MSVYPKWLYNKEEGGRILYSADEESALKGVWKDTPAAFEQKSETEDVSEKPSKPSKTKKAAE